LKPQPRQIIELTGLFCLLFILDSFRGKPQTNRPRNQNTRDADEQTNQCLWPAILANPNQKR
jgi:hypothetical protein